MRCEHTNGTKEKLTAFANDSRYGHDQGFVTKPSCVDCGEVLDFNHNEPMEHISPNCTVSNYGEEE